MPGDNGNAPAVTHGRLDVSPVVHQAIGVLMERHGTSIEDAFSTLCEAADRQSLPIEEVSSRVVHSVPRILPSAPASPAPRPLIALTPRELEILRELPTRSTFEEIAAACFVSTNTVKTHLHSVYQKLGVSSRRDAAAEAWRLGLI